MMLPELSLWTVFMNLTSSDGTTSTAYASEVISEKAITQGKVETKSPR